MKLTRIKDHSLPTGALGLCVTGDGGTAFVACADGALHRVDLDTGKTEAFPERHASYASGCVLLPDGRTVVSAGYDGVLLWHDIETRRCWRRVQAHRFWSWQIALSPDGKRLATVTGQYLPGGWKYEPAAETEPSVRVFDALTGDPMADYSHGPPVLSCQFSPDSRYLAAANMMGEVRIWDLQQPESAKPVSQWTSADFTSWGSIKTHHYCGGIYGLAFAPDGASLLCSGMGPMNDPMAGNGKMTWQRWNWRTSERMDQIKDGQHGSGLMESVVWHPDGSHFLMAGRQAQGTWNAALFRASDGSLVHSEDTKKRITHARFAADGQRVIIAGAQGQPSRKLGFWPAWGKIQVFQVEA